MVAMDALDELGFRVLEASSAAGALELAQAHQGAIAFAMVDLGLPDRPGEELVCELRGLYPTLPIIIASGKGAGAIDGDVRSLANVAFVTKPYDFENLRVTIERVDNVAPAYAEERSDPFCARGLAVPSGTELKRLWIIFQRRYLNR
jgi:DNA-binding response OmpR family regulator